MTPSHDAIERVDLIFSPRTHIEQILRFEAALARAEARASLVPAAVAAEIEAACRLEHIDVEAIQRDAIHAGTVAIPLVQQLIARTPIAARAYVHWGATSQDAIDTALVLQIRDGLDVLGGELRRIAEAAAALAAAHRRSVMPGRTLLQQAVPITFGLKAARWLAAVTRQLRSIQTLRGGSLVLQFGGAAGTLAALGPHGDMVARLLGEELGLPVPELPWHAERDRTAGIVATLGVTAGVIAKLAGDIILLAQTEVGEVAEGATGGAGGSSAMPQKRNPVSAVSAAAAASLAIGIVPVVLSAMQHEHERAAGGWQSEWTAIPDVFRHTVRAASHLASALASLDVRVDRMRANLAAAAGTLMSESLATALAPRLGRPEAMRLVGELSERALRDGSTLRESARSDGRVTSALDAAALDRALDPSAYLGNSEQLIDRALASWHDLTRERGWS
jgi:3-carboxy-cis,cis-muconate cycloisomerase